MNYFIRIRYDEKQNMYRGHASTIAGELLGYTAYYDTSDELWDDIVDIVVDKNFEIVNNTINNYDKGYSFILIGNETLNFYKDTLDNKDKLFFF